MLLLVPGQDCLDDMWNSLAGVWHVIRATLSFTSDAGERAEQLHQTLFLCYSANLAQKLLALSAALFVLKTQGFLNLVIPRHCSQYVCSSIMRIEFLEQWRK